MATQKQAQDNKSTSPTTAHPVSVPTARTTTPAVSPPSPSER